MNTFQYAVPLRAALLCLMPCVLAAQAPFTTGLDSPIKLTRTSAGNFLVSEAGRTANSGRISLVDRAGSRRSLLSGLPSSITAEGAAGGPTATLLRNGTIYILIGILLEERDLTAMFGDDYRRYRDRVSMLLPWSSGFPQTQTTRKAQTQPRQSTEFGAE